MNGEAEKALTGSDRYEVFIKPSRDLMMQSAQARGEVAGLKAAMQAGREVQQAKDVASVEEGFARSVKDAPQREGLRSKQEKISEPFIPTKDNAASLATIFALTNIAGFALGAGGKRNSQASLSAMNGMLEGYQKGRMDLYKKEKDIFDANQKQLKTSYDILYKELQDALETYKTDKQAGLAKAQIAYAQRGADFMQQHLAKVGLANNYELFKQAYDSDNKKWSEINREEERARAQAFREQQEKNRAEDQAERQKRDARAEERAERREERAETRFERMISKATTASSKKEGKPLPDKQARDIEGLASIEDGLLQLKQDWKPEYAQAGLPAVMGGFGAQLKADLERRFGRETAQGMISWWSRYQRYQAPNRHALFGATLTGNELKNYQTFTATISDAPKTVETMLDDQITYVRSTAANKIFNAESTGYRVPESRRVNFDQTFGGGTGAASAANRSAAPAAGSQVDVNTERKNARAAIASGAPEAAVRQRFKQKTGQEL